MAPACVGATDEFVYINDSKSYIILGKHAQIDIERHEYDYYLLQKAETNYDFMW